MTMFKILIIFILIYYSSSSKECYENFLNFGDEFCIGNTSMNIPYKEIFNGKLCKDIACMSRLDTIKASVCIRLKDKEFKITFIEDEKNSTFDIPTTITDNDPFSIKQIAVSDTHFSLLLISNEAAYRMQFFIEELKEANNFELEYIGSANNYAWHPLADSDVYMEMNGTGIKNTKQWPHRKMNANDSNSKALIHGNSYKPCLKWNEIKLVLPTTVNLSPLILPESQPRNSEGGITPLHVVAGGVIIVLLAILFVVYNAMKWEHDSSNSSVNSVAYNARAHAIALVEDRAGGIPAAVPVQPPPPPSYHTHDQVVQAIEQIQAEITYLTRSLSQQNHTANSRSQVPVELESLLPQTNDSLVNSKM